ncbi:lytic transglycosylase domain-containing protein [Ornithinimicrobium sp. Y1847]|uniref:lytic transglycosylase domain-containing protein n=1 Tax=unclassified Ornithinimicrobium TaxID=2615080 RepID=UPI003B67710F
MPRRRSSGPLVGALVVAVVIALVLALVRGTGGGEEIREQMIDAYQGAIEQLPEHAPGCEGLTWEVLAGIGRVESHHARGSAIDAFGNTNPRILGPRLDGSGAGGNVTPIHDTDDGRWDGDTEYDRAVGPMQFIPTSWELYGRDGNGDGVADPHNVHDATLAAAVHLCGFSAIDLSDRATLRSAILRYNQSGRYADTVLEHADRYAEQYAPQGD